MSTARRSAVVIPGITRPLPPGRLLPWLFRELPRDPARRVAIVDDLQRGPER